MILLGANIWERISGGMRDQVSPLYIFLIIGGGVLGFLVAGFALYRWRNSAGVRIRRACSASFNDLAGGNQLSRRQRDLLWRAARAEGMEDPLEIYLRRSIFEARIVHTPATPEEISDLRRKLYQP